MGSLLRLRSIAFSAEPRFLFANPANLENDLVASAGHLAHDRKRLTVRLSHDDCQTWPITRVLEEGPSGYSDLAAASDGWLYCLYEDGMVDRMTDTRYITVARFDETWLNETATS